MHLQSTTVFNETQLSKFIHEKINPLARGTHLLRQHLLVDFGNRGLIPTSLTKVGQHDQKTSETFLAAIKQLVLQILLIRRLHVSR